MFVWRATRPSKSDANAAVTVAGSYLFLLIYALLVIATSIGGAAYAMPAIFVLIIVPIADALSTDNTFDAETTTFDRVQRALLSAAPAAFVMFHFLALSFFASNVKMLTLLEASCAALSMGIAGALMFLAGHDLIHRSTSWGRAVGRLGLALIGYSHFEINHNQGHHLHMGTPEDTSTARSGESAWRYVLRSAPANYRLSWELARANPRLMKTMVLLTALQAAVAGYFFLLSGWSGLAFWLTASLLSIFLAEVGMYCAHYGVVRRRDSAGRYERQTAMHCWDTYHRFSGYLSFGGNRHASHHLSASKPYYLLTTRRDARRLPFGIPLMTLIALFPPLYLGAIKEAPSSRSLPEEAM